MITLHIFGYDYCSGDPLHIRHLWTAGCHLQSHLHMWNQLKQCHGAFLNSMTSSKLSNFSMMWLFSILMFYHVSLMYISCEGKIKYCCICGARLTCTPWGGKERDRKESWDRGWRALFATTWEEGRGEEWWLLLLLPQPWQHFPVPQKPGFTGLWCEQRRQEDHGYFAVPSRLLPLATDAFACTIKPALIFCRDFVCWFPGYMHPAKKHLK